MHEAHAYPILKRDIAMREKIKVIGCPNGMDSNDPKTTSKICYTPCEWRINSKKHFNCSWVLFEYLAREEKSLTLREVGEMLGTTHETVRSIERIAMEKMSKATVDKDGFFDYENDDDYMMRSAKKHSKNEISMLEKLKNALKEKRGNK